MLYIVWLFSLPTAARTSCQLITSQTYSPSAVVLALTALMRSSQVMHGHDERVNMAASAAPRFPLGLESSQAAQLPYARHQLRQLLSNIDVSGSSWMREDMQPKSCRRKRKRGSESSAVQACCDTESIEAADCLLMLSAKADKPVKKKLHKAGVKKARGKRSKSPRCGLSAAEAIAVMAQLRLRKAAQSPRKPMGGRLSRLQRSKLSL